MYFKLVFLYSFVSCIRTEHSHSEHGISDSEHYGGKEHNTDYDHDAFLGKGHGHDFDTLRPEESKEKLRKMAEKIDTNNDNMIEFQELYEWIEIQRTSYMWDTLDKVIHSMDENKDGQLSWEEFKFAHFGKFQNEDDMGKELREKVQKNKRKFKLADTNNDGVLIKEEFVFFRHPEESPDETMREIAVDEVMEEMDTHGDNVIDMEDFLGQYGDHEETPDWVKDDRRHFQETLDKDKSGALERDELRDWVLPNRKDSVEEAQHLIKDCDDDEDKKLSFHEIIDHYRLFVGSTATDHGKALHKEL